MSFEIIGGRNNGYPCIPELEERNNTDLTAPLCQFMFVPGESGYPALAQMPDAEPGISDLPPECMMFCFGEQVNGGYPWIRNLKAVVRASFSQLYFGDKHVNAVHYEGKAVETAYCNGCKVFDTYLSRIKIV